MYDVTRKYNCIEIGVQGENLSRDIQFDCNAWIKKLGAGTVTLVHQRWGDEYPYPCPVEMEDGIATWHPTSADVQFEGWGMLNVTFVVGEKIAKSIIYPTHVADSLGQEEEPPEEYQAWIDYVATLAAQAETARNEAVQAKEEAEDARDAAEGFADDAEQSAQTAEQSAQNAAQSADEAEGFAQNAEQSAQDAETAKDAAESAQSSAESARDVAQASAQNAAQSEANAAQSETNAETAAETAESAMQAILDTTATASVDANVGTPAVVVTKSEISGHANLDFAFQNLKGEDGDSGVYVGGDTPGPHEGQNVWIDPDGTASQVLPTVTDADNGKILKVVNGEWDKAVGGGGSGAVDSVNGQTGTVVLTASNINTSGGASIESALSTLNTSVSGLGTNKENVSNKVRTITSTSTDTEYPSAKAVYEFARGAGAVTSVNSKTGDVVLSASDINVSAGVTIAQSLSSINSSLSTLSSDAVKNVNGKTGNNVTLFGSDIEIGEDTDLFLDEAITELNSEVADIESRISPTKYQHNVTVGISDTDIDGVVVFSFINSTNTKVASVAALDSQIPEIAIPGYEEVHKVFKVYGEFNYDGGAEIQLAQVLGCQYIEDDDNVTFTFVTEDGTVHAVSTNRTESFVSIISDDIIHVY